jgi:hypothetical protein
MQTEDFLRHALLPKPVRATDLASIVAEAELRAKAVLRRDAEGDDSGGECLR